MGALICVQIGVNCEKLFIRLVKSFCNTQMFRQGLEVITDFAQQHLIVIVTVHLLSSHLEDVPAVAHGIGGELCVQRSDHGTLLFEPLRRLVYKRHFT